MLYVCHKIRLYCIRSCSGDYWNESFKRTESNIYCKMSNAFTQSKSKCIQKQMMRMKKKLSWSVNLMDLFFSHRKKLLAQIIQPEWTKTTHPSDSKCVQIDSNHGENGSSFFFLLCLHMFVCVRCVCVSVTANQRICWSIRIQFIYFVRCNFDFKTPL